MKMLFVILVLVILMGCSGGAPGAGAGSNGGGSGGTSGSGSGGTGGSGSGGTGGSGSGGGGTAIDATIAVFNSDGSISGPAITCPDVCYSPVSSISLPQ